MFSDSKAKKSFRKHTQPLRCEVFFPRLLASAWDIAPKDGRRGARGRASIRKYYTVFISNPLFLIGWIQMQIGGVLRLFPTALRHTQASKLIRPGHLSVVSNRFEIALPRLLRFPHPHIFTLSWDERRDTNLQSGVVAILLLKLIRSLLTYESS